MTDYWKSNDRKFCDFCKCWITDNKPSVAFHENGRRHKANVAKRISDISRNSEKSEKEKQKMDQDIRKMEEAALKSYAHDVSTRADITARSISAVMAGSGDAAAMVLSASGTPLPSTSDGGVSGNSDNRGRPLGAQIDPLMPPDDFDAEHEDGPRVTKSRPITQNPADAAIAADESLWVEAKSPEGYTYYWNVKTNESIWEAPKEGYMKIDEYNRINQIAVAQQQLQLEKETKTFQDSATEVVARYNRERLKAYRRPDTAEEIEKHKQKREQYKTEEDLQGVAAAPVGVWQPVVKEEKKIEEHINYELPKQDHYIPQVVTELSPEPPMKKFKEKQIESLDPQVITGTSATFKKRKFAAKGNTRQRLDVD